MSVESIEARAAEFIGLHKHDLARFLARAEAKLKELGHDVASLFADEAPAETIGGFRVIADPSIPSDEVRLFQDSVPVATLTNVSTDTASNDPAVAEAAVSTKLIGEPEDTPVIKAIADEAKVKRSAPAKKAAKK